MSKNLRNKIIRLAHSKPELRKHLLPLLSKTGGVYYDPNPPTRSHNEARELANAFAKDLEKVLGVKVDAQYNDDDNIGYEFRSLVLMFPDNDSSTYFTPRGQSYTGWEVTKDRILLNKKIKRAVKVVAKKHKAILVGRDSITNPKVKGYKDQWGDRETWYDRNTAEVWYSIPKYPHNDNK